MVAGAGFEPIGGIGAENAHAILRDTNIQRSGLPTLRDPRWDPRDIKGAVLAIAEWRTRRGKTEI